MSAPATSPTLATVQPVSVPTMQAPTDAQEAPTSAVSGPQSPTTSASSPAQSPVQSAPPTPAANGAKAVSIVQRLELVGAFPKQPTIIETISFSQELPDGIRRQQELFIQLIQPDDSWLDRDVPSDYRRGGLYGD